MNFGEFRVIDPSMKSAAAISRGRRAADGGRTARRGAALAGARGPGANSRAPTAERQQPQKTEFLPPPRTSRTNAVSYSTPLQLSNEPP